jgi:hypothetical protein
MLHGKPITLDSHGNRDSLKSSFSLHTVDSNMLAVLW